MDRDKQPGIILRGIRLVKSEFYVKDNYDPAPEMQSEIKKNVEFIHEKQVSEDKLEGAIHFGVKITNLIKGEECLICTVIFEGSFNIEIGDSQNMELNEFLNFNAPAIIYPFIRSHIVDLSAKARIPIIMLPILNLPATMKRHFEKLNLNQNMIDTNTSDVIKVNE